MIEFTCRIEEGGPVIVSHFQGTTANDQTVEWECHFTGLNQSWANSDTRFAMIRDQFAVQANTFIKKHLMSQARHVDDPMIG